MEIRRLKSGPFRSRDARDRIPASTASAVRVRLLRDSRRAAALPQRVGFRISLTVFVLLIPTFTASADTNSIPDVPSSLRPPRGELMPGFWELYGGWVILGAILFLLGLATFVWLLLLPKPLPPVQPAAQARRQLEPLRQRNADGPVLSRVSQIVRYYVTSTFALPPGEHTTTELTGTLRQNQNIGPELGGEVIHFLRECDLRKFAPSPPNAPFDAVSRALSLIDRAESRVAELNQLAHQNSPDSKRNRHMQQEQEAPREA